MQDDNEAVRALLVYILTQLQRSRSIDQAQGLLALVLRMHGERIAAVPQLAEVAAELHASLAAVWAGVDEDMHAVRYMTAMFGQTKL